MTPQRAETTAQRRGRAFHALMEAWPLLDLDRALAPDQLVLRPVWARLLAPFALTQADRLQAVQSAQQLLQAPLLRSWIGLPPASPDPPAPAAPGTDPAPVSPEQRWIERSWAAQGSSVLRPDWVVRWPAPILRVRVVDWKWAVLPSEQEAYTQQLMGYQALMAEHFPDHVREAALVTSRGEIWRLTDQGLVHWNPAGRPAL